MAVVVLLNITRLVLLGEIRRVIPSLLRPEVISVPKSIPRRFRSTSPSPRFLPYLPRPRATITDVATVTVCFLSTAPEP